MFWETAITPRSMQGRKPDAPPEDVFTLDTITQRMPKIMQSLGLYQVWGAGASIKFGAQGSRRYQGVGLGVRGSCLGVWSPGSREPSFGVFGLGYQVHCKWWVLFCKQGFEKLFSSFIQ